VKKGSAIKITKMFLVIILFTLFTFKQQVYAADTKSYSILDYNINILINTDGSASFEERLTYNFSGQFNGVTRDIDFSLTKGLKDKKVYVMENDKLRELKLNSGNSLDSDGNSGTYNFVQEGNLARLKIFEHSKDQRKIFVIKYKLIDAVTKYKDTAEFNRKVVDTKWQTALNSIKIKITLPPGATKEELKIFAHGPLQGYSSIIDGSNVEFQVPTVLQGKFVETLVLFPIKLVPLASNIVNENALPRIIANETNLANEANKTREENRLIMEEYDKKYELLQQKKAKEKEQQAIKQLALRSIGNPITIFLILLWFPIIIYIYRKYDKELKPSFKGKYYRELPGEYTPAEMSILMSFGKVNTRDVMATLMDLARKKQLIISQHKSIKDGLLGDKKITQYVIKLNEKAPFLTLKKHEKFLIKWFITKIGNGKQLNLDEIKKYVKKKSNALIFKGDYDKWVSLVKEEADKNDFFDETCKKRIFIGVIIGILYLLIGGAIAILLFTPMAIIPIILGVIIFGFSLRIKRRTKYGNEQYAMWKSFKNFLKDFSRLDKAEIPSIILWEHYLVYAISLGVAKKVIKQLPLVFTDEDLNNESLSYMYGVNFGYFSGFGEMFDNTINTVESSISTAQSVASSQDSSSSGGGGGFSGGSSGGGGGGGGGGAF